MGGKPQWADWWRAATSPTNRGDQLLSIVSSCLETWTIHIVINHLCLNHQQLKDRNLSGCHFKKGYWVTAQNEKKKKKKVKKNLHPGRQNIFRTQNRTDELNYYLLSRDAIIIIKVFNTNSQYIPVIHSKLKTNAKIVYALGKWLLLCLCGCEWDRERENTFLFVSRFSPVEKIHVESCKKYEFLTKIKFKDFCLTTNFQHMWQGDNISTENPTEYTSSFFHSSWLRGAVLHELDDDGGATATKMLSEIK